MLNAALPSTVQNLDLINLATQVMRFVEEHANCQSASRDDTNQHDLRRCQDMVDFFNTRWNNVVGTPELDTPYAHPEDYEAPVWPKLPEKIQNADLTGLINLWSLIVIELLRSNSAERATGVSEADAQRIVAIVEKIQNNITTMVADPSVDLPDAADLEPAKK